MMMAVARRIGHKHAVNQQLNSEKGNILQFHSVQMCVLFAALQISTSQLSLIILGYLGTAGFTAMFCSYFWTAIMTRARTNVLSLLALIVANAVLYMFATATVRRGNKEVMAPGWFIFFFYVLTAINMVLGYLLAGLRIALLLIMSILDISRVDRSLLPYLRWLDAGYTGFYGMLLLQEGFGRYFLNRETDR